jgi:uncharacterized protein (DUF2141 family)
MRNFYWSILLVLMCSCAQVTPLTGGPKDIYAPTIDSAKTFPYNGQLNYNSKMIELKFNEFIQLKKPNENILIIPQQAERPIITSKNKKLSIELIDNLLPNTTYNVTFNNAVQDLSERNDSVFQFVFSTGDYIDSLQISGNVSDAFTNRALDGMLIGLYPDSIVTQFDSIPFKKRPTYLVQSDSKGDFKMNYIKNGTYYLFAFKDKNKNLKLDPNEPRAFVTEQVLELNQNIDSIQLRAFLPTNLEVELEDLDFIFPGQVEVILSNPPDSFAIKSQLNLIQENTGKSDSLIYWLEENPVPKMKFITYLNGEIDTLKPIFSGRPDKIETVKMKATNNVLKGKLFPNENLIVTFTEPIFSFDTTLIRAFDKDANQLNLPRIKSQVRELMFDVQETSVFEIRIDSAAVTSLYKRSNESQIKVLFDCLKDDYYGNLIVNVDSVFAESGIIQLLNMKSELIKEVTIEKQMTFNNLLPGDYQIRLILDADANGKWSEGNMSTFTEPEKVIYYSGTAKVKSKWDKEIDWIFSK